MVNKRMVCFSGLHCNVSELNISNVLNNDTSIRKNLKASNILGIIMKVVILAGGFGSRLSEKPT